MDAINVTADNFSHKSNTQRENLNAIFTIEKLDKLDKLEDMLKDLTINNAKYCLSNTATMSDAQGDHEIYTKTVTHTSDGKGKVRYTKNDNIEQELLSNQTLPVVFLKMNPRIYDRNATIIGASQMILTPETKEVVADTACGSAWVSRTPRQVSQTGIDGSNPGDVCNVVSIKHATSQVLIGSVTTSPYCGLRGILKVAKKRQFVSPSLGGNTQKLYTAVDGNLPDDLDCASIFRDIIGHKLSNDSSDEF